MRRRGLPTAPGGRRRIEKGWDSSVRSRTGMRTQKVWQGGHQKRGMQEGAAMHQWALSASAELIAANVHWPGKAVTMRHLRLLGPATVFVCLSLTPVQAQTY